MTSNQHAERVAENLRGLMARRRISQASLAGALGLSRASVYRRMTGETALDVNELAAVAELLGVSTAELLAEPAVVSQ